MQQHSVSRAACRQGNFMQQCLLGRLYSASAAMLPHRRADELGAGLLQMGWTACSAWHSLQCHAAGAECADPPAAAKKKPEKNPPHSPNTSRLQPLSQEMLDFFASRWACSSSVLGHAC